MRPTTIKDEDVPFGAHRAVFAAPNGSLTDDDIRPVEALISEWDGETPAVSVKIELEDGDLQKLIRGEPIWVTMIGGLAPFSIMVGPRITNE